MRTGDGARLVAASRQVSVVEEGWQERWRVCRAGARAMTQRAHTRQTCIYHDASLPTFRTRRHQMHQAVQGTQYRLLYAHM
jgi:hypothetical protein